MHEGEATFFEALVRSLSMILVSEIGDETFIIAAILAMRNPKRMVFSGAIAALTVMTVISAALGYVVPNLISKQTTHNAATLLYTFFGLRLLYIGYKSKNNEIQEEIAEVNNKLVSLLNPFPFSSRLDRRFRSSTFWKKILAATTFPLLEKRPDVSLIVIEKRKKTEANLPLHLFCLYVVGQVHGAAVDAEVRIH